MQGGASSTLSTFYGDGALRHVELGEIKLMAVGRHDRIACPRFEHQRWPRRVRRNCVAVFVLREGVEVVHVLEVKCELLHPHAVRPWGLAISQSFDGINAFD